MRVFSIRATRLGALLTPGTNHSGVADRLSAYAHSARMRAGRVEVYRRQVEMTGRITFIPRTDRD